MYLQVTPEESSAIDSALSQNARLSCTTLSMRPGTLSSQTPAPNSKAPEETSTIEVLSGSGSRSYVVPKNPAQDAQDSTPPDSKDAVVPPKKPKGKDNALEKR